MGLDPKWNIKEIIRRHPATEGVFARFGLDTCCGGGLPPETAARAHGVEPRELLEAIDRAIEEAARPAWASQAPDREVDAASILAEGREPFPEIMNALGDLKAGGVLRVRAPFEPVPLIEMLGGMGYETCSSRAADHWAAFFRKP